MPRFVLPFALACGLACHGAHAQTDRYQITAEERAACQPDAQRLCSGTYPDEEKMIACMKANRQALSSACATVFAAGLKWRGLR